MNAYFKIGDNGKIQKQETPAPGWMEFPTQEDALDYFDSLPKGSPIELGELAVANAGLSAARLVTLMDLLLQTKEAGQLEAKPKLVALYTWLQTVKALAVAGNIDFPPAPHTFEEVVSE